MKKNERKDKFKNSSSIDLKRYYNASDLQKVDAGKPGAELIGAFSFSKSNCDLREALNAELCRYLGTPDHRARVAKYGFTRAEIDGVVGEPLWMPILLTAVSAALG